MPPRAPISKSPLPPPRAEHRVRALRVTETNLAPAGANFPNRRHEGPWRSGCDLRITGSDQGRGSRCPFRCVTPPIPESVFLSVSNSLAYVHTSLGLTRMAAARNHAALLRIRRDESISTAPERLSSLVQRLLRASVNSP